MISDLMSNYHQENIKITMPLKILAFLFEPELKKFSSNNFLNNYSKNTTLIILWEGLYEKQMLYHLSLKIGIKISLKNISHTVL